MLGHNPGVNLHSKFTPGMGGNSYPNITLGISPNINRILRNYWTKKIYYIIKCIYHKSILHTFIYSDGDS